MNPGNTPRQGFVVTRLTRCDKVPVYCGYGGAFFQAHRMATIYGTRDEADLVAKATNDALPWRTGDERARTHRLLDVDAWLALDGDQ